MRVIYYTYPHFLESAILFSHALCQRADFHLLLELSPSSWERAMFDIKRVPLSAGVQPAAPILGCHFPPRIREYWRDLASFNLIVHTSQRSIHPATWWTSRSVIRFIRNLKPDIFHLDDPDMSLRLSLAVRELDQGRLLLNVHDPSPHSGERDWRKSLARRLIFPHVDRFILHNQTQVKTFCYENYANPDSVSVIRLGSYELYRDWMTDPIAQSDRTVLFFGRLTSYKGLEVLYDAARYVAQRIPNMRFIIAGRPEPKYVPPHVPALARGGQIVLIQQYIGNAQLADLFQQATIVACPYLDATQSGVVLTAYAFNRAVVGSAVGGLPEYIMHDRTGLLVPPGNSQELAAALLRLLLNSDLRKRFQDQIRSLKTDSFSWARVADQAMNLYERAISSQ
jgi:glycosyltransferase involved in cell wall biosynthesis